MDFRDITLILKYGEYSGSSGWNHDNVWKEREKEGEKAKELCYCGKGSDRSSMFLTLKMEEGDISQTKGKVSGNGNDKKIDFPQPSRKGCTSYNISILTQYIHGIFLIFGILR